MGLRTHDVTMPSPSRAAIWYPTVESAMEVDQGDRQELARLGRFAYENFPLARHLVECMTALVVGEDGLTLTAMTADKDWNEENEARWKAKAAAPGRFDLRRRWDFTTSLEAHCRGQMVDGDFFTILTKSQDGRNARFAFQEGTICRSPARHQQDVGSRWADGVRIDGVRGAAEYCFYDLDREVGSARRTVLVRASDVIHFADIIRPGHVRGNSKLGVCLAHMVDRSEIQSYLKHGIKIRNRQALFASGVEVKAPQLRGPNAGPGDDPKIDYNKLYAGGHVQQLGRGGDIKMLHDISPHMNYQSWDENLITEIALGYGLPVEVVWNMVKLNAANQRFIMEKTQVFRARYAQKLVNAYASRAYVYDTAMAIKHGIIRPPSDAFWWLHGWLMPSKLTIDKKGLGALNIQLNRRGLVTAKNLYGCDAKNWKAETDQWAEEEAYRTKAILDRLGAAGVTVEDYLRLNGDNVSVAAQAQPEEGGGARPVGGDDD